MRCEILYKSTIKLISVKSYGKKLNEDYLTHKKYPTFKVNKYSIDGRCLYLLFLDIQCVYVKRKLYHKMQHEKFYKLHLKTLFYICTLCFQNGQKSWSIDFRHCEQTHLLVTQNFACFKNKRCIYQINCSFVNCRVFRALSCGMFFFLSIKYFRW